MGSIAFRGANHRTTTSQLIRILERFYSLKETIKNEMNYELDRTIFDIQNSQIENDP